MTNLDILCAQREMAKNDITVMKKNTVGQQRESVLMATGSAMQILLMNPLHFLILLISLNDCFLRRAQTTAKVVACFEKKTTEARRDQPPRPLKSTSFMSLFVLLHICFLLFALLLFQLSF